MSDLDGILGAIDAEDAAEPTTTTECSVVKALQQQQQSQCMTPEILDTLRHEFDLSRESTDSDQILRATVARVEPQPLPINTSPETLHQHTEQPRATTERLTKPPSPPSPPSPTLSPPSPPRRPTPSPKDSPIFSSPPPKIRIRRPRKRTKKTSLDMSQPKHIMQMKWHERVASGSREREAAESRSLHEKSQRQEAVFKDGDLIAFGESLSSAQGTGQDVERGERAMRRVEESPRPSFLVL
ncbi:Endocytosis protein end4 [Elsinoe australis]|uniref:Endocytosis protein end4 n=1 Tax=Elsinoe australis TaxID=40998 RepID=A0A2P7YEG6_9PEZI|nr:Endocytosis protein end4 [Elsinoe australis]